MTEAIERFGALGVFLLMVPESACVPVPSEITLLFAGFAVHNGWMSLPLAIVAATAGNLVGSLLAYGIGFSGALERVPGVRAVVLRWGALIDRHGPRAVLIARLLPLARTFVSLPAGARRVPFGQFVVLSTIGCALWAATFVLVGLSAGAAWVALSGVLGRVLLAIGLIAIALTFLKVRRSD